MATRPLDAQLFEMLRCPVTLSKLKHTTEADGEWLISEVGGLKYPIRDGIPVMLPEEATLPEGVASLEEFRKRYHRPR